MKPGLLVFLLLAAAPAFAEPPLPAGLGTPPEKQPEKQDAPVLPPGLLAPAPEKPETTQRQSGFAALGVDFRGFAETRFGLRLQSDPYQKAAAIEEARLQLAFGKDFSFATASLTADFLYDAVPAEHGVKLETGAGWFDLREANMLFRPTGFSDLKIGRQVLTWGTGDLLFINDLFPKDWNAFFIGRDEEYLKAPSDAAKLALFSAVVNLDIVYTPRFDADRFIGGDRLSYYNAGLGRLAGRDALVAADRPDDWFRDDEIALRLHRPLGTAEIALYVYDGYWKSPAGQDIGSGLASFPRLSVYGASVRRPLMGGIANAEAGYYDSRDDRAGDNPLVANGEARFLIGFEREIAPELTGAVQYYLEHMLDHAAYLASLPSGLPARDRDRHVVTLRLTRLAMNQTLIWSLFAYLSPSDRDAYLRPKVSYKLTDAWRLEAGANIFFGKDDFSFFGQFGNNSNLFAGLRLSF